MGLNPLLVLLAMVLAVAGCAAPTSGWAPPWVPTATATSDDLCAVGTPVGTVEAPAARRGPVEAAGQCRSIQTIYLAGFTPGSIVTVTCNFDVIECATGNRVPDGYWKAPYGKTAGPDGQLEIRYVQEATGGYRYTFTDETGRQATLEFSTAP